MRSVTHTTWSALRTGVGSLRQHPSLAAAVLVTTLAQGALQGGMVLALRQVLITLSRPGGGSTRVLLVGAVAVFGVWLLRSAVFYAAQVFDARLASRVELQWMGRVLQKLLTLSVGFFDKSSRGE